MKLMGALSVWLGFRMTLMVLIVSTFMVLIITAVVVGYSILTRGVKSSKKKYLATGKRRIKPGERPTPETVHQKQDRRIMAYATPVALATWAVMLWNLPNLP